MRQRSNDPLVKLAAYATFIGAAVSMLTTVLTFIFTGVLKDPSNRDLAPIFLSIHDLGLAVGWGLLGLVAVGLYRLVRPPSITARIGLASAVIGVAIVVLSTLVAAATATTGSDLPLRPIASAGQVFVAAWLVLANSDLRRLKVFSKGLTLAGILFGVGMAWIALVLWLGGTARSLGSSVALLIPFGFLVWQPWLGVTLLRPLPVIEPAGST